MASSPTRNPTISSVIALLLLLTSAPRGMAQGELVDGVAAVVNDEVITFSMVREVVASRERALSAMYQGEELVTQVQQARQGALTDLINRQLVISEFNKAGLAIPDRIIERQIDTLVREQFGDDRQAFLRTLQAQGYTLSKFKDIERDKIIVQAMRQRNVKSPGIVSPQKVEKFYHDNRKEFSSPAQAKLRMIVINKATGEPDSSEATQKALATEIREKLAGGADFERMAQMYSDDSTSELGGDWGWIDEKTLTAELSKQVFRLKAGEVSQVIDFSTSYYILMVEARKNSVTRPLKEVRDDIEKLLQQEERIENQKKWIDTLRKKAFIKTY